MSYTDEDVRNFLDAYYETQHEAWQIAEDHGWHEKPEHGAVRIALMHSELSEALEELRKKDPNKEAIEEELADLVIRLMDFAQIEGYDVASAIVKKMDKNRSRPYRHGGKRF